MRTVGPRGAMVLAAGLGIRMRPLTALAPKPALPVLNRPLIAHVLEHLASHGVSFAVINTHHMPQRIEEAVMRTKPPSLEVIFSHEGAILGTAGGLGKAAEHFAGAPFYLVNSDSLTDVDLTAAAAAHAGSGRAATLIVRPHDPDAGYRPVGVAAFGGPGARLVGIAGRRWGREEAAPRTFTGIHVLEPSVLGAIPPATVCDINADIYPRLLDGDPDSVGTWLHEGWWFEAGGPARYLDLNLEVLERSGRGTVVGPGGRIDPRAHVSRSVIGSRVRVARGAVVEDCVLWDDVSVGEGIALKRCIVTQGVEAPPISLGETLVMSEKGGHLLLHPLRGSA